MSKRNREADDSGASGSPPPVSAPKRIDCNDSPNEVIVVNLANNEDWVNSLINDNRYSSFMTEGPFFAYIYNKNKSSFLGNYHPMRVGKILLDAGVPIVKILKGGNEKIIVIFASGQEANNFVENGCEAANNQWFAIIPDNAIFSSAIVKDVPLELSVEEIFSGLDSDSKKIIKKITRCRQRDPNSNYNDDIAWIDSNDVKILVEGTIPYDIAVYKFPIKVRKYVNPSRKCHNCQRFGHLEFSCRSSRRCINCSEPHSGEQCSIQPKCANCLGPHRSDDPDCFFYIFHLELNETKAKLGRSQFQAYSVVKDKFLDKFGKEENHPIFLVLKSFTDQGEESNNLTNSDELPLIGISLENPDELPIQLPVVAEEIVNSG